MTIKIDQVQENYDCVVIGGGFYGCSIAEQLSREGRSVLLVEKGSDLMQRASYVNQARIHQGYHYPRSLLTSVRSRINFSKFVDDYANCVCDDFESYYAIGKLASKVTANQFQLFCERIGAPLQRAPEEVKDLFSRDHIEDVFEVREYAFNADKLNQAVLERLFAARVDILIDTEASRVTGEKNRVRLKLQSGDEAGQVFAPAIFNCSYSNINHIMSRSGLPLVKLKHELTEIALIEVPDVLKKMSVTVVDGPFFSAMPFPTKDLHSLTHVRYTPHSYWIDDSSDDYLAADQYLNKLGIRSRYQHMQADAKRYLPVLGESRYIESLWEIKTVLPKSEIDDSRPILFQQSEEFPGLVSIMGGKLDNIYDVKERLAAIVS